MLSCFLIYTYLVCFAFDFYVQASMPYFFFEYVLFYFDNKQEFSIAVGWSHSEEL